MSICSEARYRHRMEIQPILQRSDRRSPEKECAKSRALVHVPPGGRNLEGFITGGCGTVAQWRGCRVRYFLKNNF